MKLRTLIYDIETGRLERSLSALTAMGALVSGAEIWIAHDRASFGNSMMWLPVIISPVAAAAGVGGFFSKRMAKTVLPVTSAVVIANGLQGLYFHARGVSQRPGGWREFRYNLEMGPPVFAPLLVTLVGGIGLFAAALRREDD